MKLDVLPSDQATEAPWYSDGLHFTCSQCGNCCSGPPGYVWITREEIAKLAEHLSLSPQQVIERYCRRIDGKFSLIEKRGPGGSYDCIFLEEVPAPKQRGQSTRVTHSIRRCAVYSVRPLQCRTWPFWPENLSSQSVWDHSAQRCHGMNAPGRKFSLTQIHAIRDAAQWPKNPPTSKPGKSKQ